VTLSIPPLIESFNVGPLTVHRPAPPVQNDWGGYDEGVDVLVTVDPVSVHTLRGRDLWQVPEADRNREIIVLYTTARLYVADDGNVADRVDYQGHTYRVITVEDYDSNGGCYTARAALEDGS
jgi:hypothetical protein